MKKSVIILIIVIFSAVLTGCETQSNNPGNFENYRTGSQALELRLINPGVEDYFENDEADILIEVFNRGTADVTQGEFFVSGFDTNYVNYVNIDPTYIDIQGKSKDYNTNGEYSTIVSARTAPLRLPKNSDQFTNTFKFVSCYDYKTVAVANVCIDPDPNSRRVSQKICTMSSVSPGPQGAPLVVSSVTPKVSGSDLRLDIQVSHSGSGIIYDKNLANEQCFARLDKYDDLNKIKMNSVIFSGQTMDCSGSMQAGEIRLVNGNARITCVCQNCLQNYVDAYNTQMTFEFEYGYRNEITKSIRVLKD